MPHRSLRGNWFEEEAYEADKRALRQKRLEASMLAGTAMSSAHGSTGAAQSEMLRTAGQLTLGQKVMLKVGHHRIPYPLFGATTRSKLLLQAESESVPPPTIVAGLQSTASIRASAIGDEGSSDTLRFYTPVQLLNLATMGVLALDLDDRQLGVTGWQVRCTTSTTDVRPMLRNVFVLVPASMTTTLPSLHGTLSAGPLAAAPCAVTNESSVRPSGQCYGEYGSTFGSGAGTVPQMAGASMSSTRRSGGSLYSASAGPETKVIQDALKTHTGVAASPAVQDRLLNNANWHAKTASSVAPVWRPEQRQQLLASREGGGSGSRGTATMTDADGDEQLVIHYGQTFRIQTVPELLGPTLQNSQVADGPLYLASELSSTSWGPKQQVYLTPDVTPQTLWRFEFGQRGYRDDAKGFPVREAGMKLLVHNATAAPLGSSLSKSRLNDFGACEYEVSAGAYLSYASRRRAAPETMENAWLVITGDEDAAQASQSEPE